MTPAVFLDRDGTLIREVGYLDRLERLEMFSYTVDAVRLLDRRGFPVRRCIQGSIVDAVPASVARHLSGAR